MCAADRLTTTLFFLLRFPHTGNWKMTKLRYFPLFFSFSLPKIQLKKKERKGRSKPNMLHHFAFRKQKQVLEKHVIVLHVFSFTVNGIILRGDQAWGATETCRVVRRWVGPGGGARRTVTRRGWELTWDWREGEARLSGVGSSADIVSPRLWTWPFLPPRFPLFFLASSLLSQCRCSVSCFNYFRILIFSILLGNCLICVYSLKIYCIIIIFIKYLEIGIYHYYYYFFNL